MEFRFNLIVALDRQRYLFRGDHANDTATMLLRLCFHFAEFAERFNHHFHDLATFLDVSHFTATEQHADLNLVFVLEELFGLPNLGADIFLTGLGPQANLFGLGMRLTRVLFLVLVVLVFAVVHDAANWRSLIRGDLHKIKACVAGPLQSFFGGNDTELLAFFAHNPNG